MRQKNVVQFVVKIDIQCDEIRNSANNKGLLLFYFIIEGMMTSAVTLYLLDLYKMYIS